MGCKGDRTREKKSSFPTSKMILKEEENTNYERLEHILFIKPRQVTNCVLQGKSFPFYARNEILKLESCTGSIFKTLLESKL